MHVPPQHSTGFLSLSLLVGSTKLPRLTGMSVTMQMQRPTAEQLDLLNEHADSSPADRQFVVFYGKHDFNMVGQSRINMSFEDGLRKCKLRKGSALEAAVNEAVNHIRARVARPNQTAAQIYC